MKTPIKIALLCCMTANHIAMAFGFKEPIYSIFICIGMLCMPLYSLFLAEGFEYTSNRIKYGLRLAAFAAISHIPYKMVFPGWYPVTSVMFTLFLSFLCLCVMHAEINKTLRNLIIVSLVVLSAPCDWGICAPLWVMAFDYFKDKKKRAISFIGICAFYFLITQALFGPSPYIVACLLAVSLILVYDGRQGKAPKVVRKGFYVYYPLHLFIIGIIKLGGMRYGC